MEDVSDCSLLLKLVFIITKEVLDVNVYKCDSSIYFLLRLRDQKTIFLSYASGICFTVALSLPCNS